MECPHLDKDNLGLDLSVLKTINQIKCSQCDAKESIWVCAATGVLNCGRYVKGHGLRHYEASGYSVCMDVQELSVFCYACDDFVINDSPDSKLDRLRTALVELKNSIKSNSTTNSRKSSSDQNPGEEEESTSSTRRSSLRVKKPIRRRSPSVDGVNGVENNQPAIKKSRKVTTTGEIIKSQSPSSVVTPKIVKKDALKNLVGLRNLGNTCFMSAVLQSLGNINEFCHVLKQLPSLEEKKPSTKSPNILNGSIAKSRESRNKNGLAPKPTDGPIVTEELRKVLLALSSNQANHKVISPEALFHVIWKVVPRFRGYQQQDAHEFLRYMLDRLHTELLCLLPGDVNFLQKQQNLSPYSRRSTAKSSSHSLVTSIFGGTLQSEVTCLSCKTSSKKHDPFLDLSIDIPSNFSQFRNKCKDGDDKRPICTLYDCLQKFVDIEELAESERFFCNNCKSKQRSTKKFWVRRLPNVLCLHIKRFRWSPYSRTKIDTHVGFPLSGLDMSQYLLSNLHETRCSNSGSSLYDLAAVIVHHGSGAGSGHYTAFGTKNSNWYHFNDSTVSVADPETVKHCKAYILFYIQREFRLPPMT